MGELHWLFPLGYRITNAFFVTFNPSLPYLLVFLSFACIQTANSRSFCYIFRPTQLLVFRKVGNHTSDYLLVSTRCALRLFQRQNNQRTSTTTCGGHSAPFRVKWATITYSYLVKHLCSVCHKKAVLHHYIIQLCHFIEIALHIRICLELMLHI